MGQVGAWPILGELAVDGDCFLGRIQSLLPPAQLRQAIGLVVQRRCQIGQKRIGTVLSELAVDGDCLLHRVQSLLPPSQLPQAGRVVVQRRSQIGQKRIGTVLSELAVDGDCLLDRLQGFFLPSELAQPGAEIQVGFRVFGVVSWIICQQLENGGGRRSKGERGIGNLFSDSCEGLARDRLAAQNLGQ